MYHLRKSGIVALTVLALCVVTVAAKQPPKKAPPTGKKRLTPSEAYQKKVSDTVGARWNYYAAKEIDLVAIGTVRVQFRINPKGKVEKLRIISNTSNEELGNASLQSIADAQFEPIPPEVLRKLPSPWLDVDFNFTMYGN